MPIELSLEHAPLLIVTASGLVSDDEYRRHLSQCTEQIIAPGRPYAFVFDGTRLKRGTATQRQLQATWIAEHRAAIVRLNKGCGFAFSSPTYRGMLVAIHWLAPPPYPYSIHDRREAAIAWCLAKLDQAGLR